MFYNFLLLLASLFAIPKWLLQKKYRGSVLERMGLRLPPASKKSPTIWLHMVSMGETKAMATIYQSLHKKYPNGAFYLSSTTATGQAEARRSLPNADCYFLLPIDFSWVMRRLVKRISPDLLILSESDFWYHQMKYVKKKGGTVVLLNGKISERSTARFSKIPFFTKNLFGSIDHFCVQNQEYATRFISLKIPKTNISITGNLKLSNPITKLSEEEKGTWRRRLGIADEDQVITLGSTHEQEEKAILEHLPILSHTKVLVVPRHPERFEAVRKFISDLNNPQIILIDQMGILSICYQLSTVAIVGGSFIRGVGGHNIFEPIQVDIPVIFGPYMETQKELVQLILEAKAGIQVPVENLKEAITALPALKNHVHSLANHGQKVHQATWEQLIRFLR